MKLLQNENYVCMGGGNSSENWGLLDSSDPSDYFIHLSSFPSGYVILRVLSPEELSSDGVPPGLMEAALMCKNGTKYRHLRDIMVDWCICGNVRKGEVPGEAIFISKRQVKKLRV